MATSIDQALAALATLFEPDGVAAALHRGSRQRTQVAALQQLLHFLGHGRTLQWERFGADGDYGPATTAAVRAAASEREHANNGEQVDRPLLLLLMGDAARDRLSTLDVQAETLLHRGSRHRDEIRALQILLYQQGLGTELNWQRFGADGDYGPGTTRAVQRFATHRGLVSNGQRVDTAILTALLDQQQVLPAHPRRVLWSLLEQQPSEAILHQGSSHQQTIQALQRLLHELGYSEELQWQRFGADGDYGPATATAVAAAATDLGLLLEGKHVSSELLRRLLEQDAARVSLQTLLEQQQVGTQLFRGSPHNAAISALQIRLQGLGYGAELQWQRFGADGDYGAATATAVERFATDQHLTEDPNRPSSTLVATLLQVRHRVPITIPAEEHAPPRVLHIAGTAITVGNSHSQHTFRRFRRGLYTVGNQPPLAFIQAHRPQLAGLGLTDSLINVMVSVAENEGQLDAVNTWDNAFLSFGMLQWTAGTGAARGELAALLARLQQQEPSAFQRYFGAIGIGVSGLQGSYGFLTLNGRTLDNATAKEPLRELTWAFRFWHAGQDTTVQAIQVAHAAARLETFYRHRSYRPGGYFIAELVSSEYGVALLFDQHVNRPGYVTGSLEAALRRSGLGNPSRWGNDEEQRLLEHYLTVREDYGRSPMTHANQRAQVTRRYVERGIISAERGSFQAPSA